MKLSYFVLEILLRIIEMFFHVKTSANWFFGVVKSFCANFDKKI